MIFDIQKAGILKRASAFLLDFILLVILTTGFSLLLSVTLRYNDRLDDYKQLENELEESYGVDPGIGVTEEQYAAWPEEQKKCYADMISALRLVLNMTLIIATFGILLSYAVLEFVVPLILKDGQTVGKKIFGIAVIRTDGVKMSTLQLFVRTVLGKYTIETMIPVLLIVMSMGGIIGFYGPLLIALLTVAQIIIMALTKNNSLIHDLLANTVTVDKASQLIFDTEEDMIEYKRRVAAEEAAKQPY